MSRVRRGVGRYAGILSVLGLLLLLLPLGLAQAQSPSVNVAVYLDNVEVVSGQPFFTTLHVDNVPGPGAFTGIASYTFGVTYEEAKLSFPTNVGVPPCGLTGLNGTLGAPLSFSCPAGVDGIKTITAVDAEGITEGPSGNVSVLKYSGTAIAATSTTAVMTLAAVDVTDPNGESYPNPTIVNGTITIWALPSAAFTFGCTDANGSGTCDAGEAFTFTDTSANMTPAGQVRPQATTWAWTFGDGNVSSAQNPSNTYNAFPSPDPVTGVETYSVCLTVTNPAGSNGPACQDVMVEPNMVTSAAISPDNPSLQPESTLDFSVSGADQYGNPIPDGVLAANIVPMSQSWSALVPAGSIVAGTGVFTATATPGSYPDNICVDVMYKTGFAFDCTGVTVISIQALIALDKTAPFPPGLNNLATLLAKILDTVDGSNVHQDVALGIQGYSATLSVNPLKGKVLAVLAGDATWGTPLASNIDLVTGVTTVTDVQTDPLNQAPDTVASFGIHLMSCTNELVTFTLEFTEILDGNTGPVPPAGTFSKSFRRGDAKADGVVNISDALFIAQYLSGIRGPGQTLSLVHPINAATVKEDAGGDKITSADVLQIAQYVVGIRNNCFNLIAGATPPER